MAHEIFDGQSDVVFAQRIYENSPHVPVWEGATERRDERNDAASINWQDWITGIPITPKTSPETLQAIAQGLDPTQFDSFMRLAVDAMSPKVHETEIVLVVGRDQILHPVLPEHKLDNW